MLADELQTFRLKASGCSDERKMLLLIVGSSQWLLAFRANENRFLRVGPAEFAVGN
jgi:hypothetical protein